MERRSFVNEIDNAVSEAVENKPRPATVTDDGQLVFTPEYSKSDAGYISDEDADFDPSHGRCGDCVHYVDGGGCHLVRGHIDPDYYCTELFADYGVFAHEHEDYVEINAELVGHSFTWDPDDIDSFIENVEQKLQEHIDQ